MDNKKIDYTYSNNKYVRSDGKIKINKSFLIRRWINRIISLLLLIATIIITAIAIKYISQKYVIVNSSRVFYNDEVEYDIGNKIVFSNSKDWYDFALFLLKKKEASRGEIVTLPYGVAKFNNKRRTLGQDEYLIKCIEGYCEPGKEYLISGEIIYGLEAKEDETFRDKRIQR